MYAKPRKIGEAFLGRSGGYDMLLDQSLTSYRLNSPQEVWYNTLVNCSSLKVFGCSAYIHVNDGKLEPKAHLCWIWSECKGV